MPRISHPSQHTHDFTTKGCLNYDSSLLLQRICSKIRLKVVSLQMRAPAPNGLSSSPSAISATLAVMTPIRRLDQSQYHMPIRQFYECQMHNQSARRGSRSYRLQCPAVAATRATEGLPGAGLSANLPSLVVRRRVQKLPSPPPSPRERQGCPGKISQRRRTDLRERGEGWARRAGGWAQGALRSRGTNPADSKRCCPSRSGPP